MPHINMKKFGILLFSLLSVSFIEAQQVVTLEECYAWAVENYPRIRQYRLIDQSETYTLSNVGKRWLPQVSLNAKASYQSEVTQIPIDLSQLPVDISIPTLSKDQYQVTAELSQTIWDGGQAASQRLLTKSESEANRKQVQGELYAVKERINQLYFGVLLQKDLLQQNQLLQNEFQINLERVAAMIQNGTANASDKEQLEVELLYVRQKETEIQTTCRAYLQMLSFFTGQADLSAATLTVPNLLSPALTLEINRPELEMYQAQASYVESQNKLITAGLMPRLGAFVQAGYGRPGLNMLDNEFSPFYMAGVRMSWNLGQLYTLKNDRRNVDLARRKIEVNKETFLFNTRLQLIQQNEAIRKLAKLMLTDEEIIRLRANIKKAAAVKLENGVISTADLIREINAEDLAKQSAVIHRTEYLMAIYQRMYITNNE
jgi:outer membrane protein TolC